jgi:H+/Na+-translocating ferredoxin:NAD+ oxidoreductase subunit B
MNTVGEPPSVSAAHVEVARNYSSPLLQGPRMCDELLALVGHMYTEEEADIVRHMKPWKPRSASGLAKASGRPVEEVRSILERLAREKFLIIAAGKGGRTLYAIMPIVPGTFESVLIRRSPESATPWHRKFAEVYEVLFDTGYVSEYLRKPVDPVRYLPVGESIADEPMALPSDRLEVVMERFDEFAIGVCQCRLSKKLTGDGCGRMLETCTVMGPVSRPLIADGRMKKASRRDVLEVKAAAEKDGLITWMMNSESSRFGSCACSCCGCCCGALRQISQFNAPGFIAPPHFMPDVDLSACKQCEKCVDACQIGALEMLGEGEAKLLVHKSERCIGCGLCAVACPSDNLKMRPVSGYREPPRGWFTYLTRYVPNYISNVRTVRAARK